MSQDRIEISAVLVHETADAFLIDAGADEPVWVPKSQVEQLDENMFLIPEWLAKKKGLL